MRDHARPTIKQTVIAMEKVWPSNTRLVRKLPNAAIPIMIKFCIALTAPDGKTVRWSVDCMSDASKSLKQSERNFRK